MPQQPIGEPEGSVLIPTTSITGSSYLTSNQQESKWNNMMVSDKAYEENKDAKAYLEDADLCDMNNF